MAASARGVCVSWMRREGCGVLALHDDGAGSWDRLFDALVWEDLGAVQEQLVLDHHVLTEHRDILEPSPRPDRGTPPHNGLINPGVRADIRALEQRAPLQPVPRANRRTSTQPTTADPLRGV